VVLQFVLSFVLVTASLVVNDQHTFMRTKDMGFDKDNLIVINMRGNMDRNPDVTKNSFLNHPNVINATIGYGLPGEAYAGDGIRDKATNKNMLISMLTVDRDYIKTLGLKIVAGRDFSHDFPSDEKNAFILSEAAAQMLGHTDPEQALGHELAWKRWDAPDSLKEGKVIGVVKDIHLNSLQDNISPVVIHVYPFAKATLTLRIKGQDVPATIAHLESTWKQFNSDWPFEYKFLDDNFDKLYKSEQKLATLFSFFTGFTILVACLGLFGLVVYSTSQKYKEISIRKVLGATETSLIVKLGRAYVTLIAIAFVIAIPFSYFAAEAWLQKFAYHIDLSAGLFIKAALSILVISIVTVGIQSAKAARTNPVDALKEQ
jgi:putative ABC transport system permease protein